MMALIHGKQVYHEALSIDNYCVLHEIYSIVKNNRHFLKSFTCIIDENTQKTNPKDPVEDEIQDAWFKEYLKREQTLSFERLRQQETLLNITQNLLQDIKQMTYVN